MADDTDFSDVLSDIGKQYPALSPFLGNTKVQWGKSDKNRQLEFYQPWDAANPNPNSITVELYNRDLAKTPEALKSAIAGDMLHYLGAMNPNTGDAVDPMWLRMRNELMGQRPPNLERMDRRAYEKDIKSGLLDEDQMRSYDHWLNTSRADAYVRGYITPDEADEWRKHGTYDDRMTATLNMMRSYLKGQYGAQ